MGARRVLPFGSWSTPITSEIVVWAAASLSGLAIDRDDLWWSELRPDESGRTVLVRLGADGRPEDVLPPPWDARTRVHEYGGGAWWVHRGEGWFTDYRDQRLYRLVPGSEPEPVTAEPGVPAGDRYADGVVAPDGSVYAVRERHRAGAEAENQIVRIAPTGEVEVVVSGPDFVSDPRPSPDGNRLCWLEWDHPNMPWDSTRLVVDGRVVAGGATESVFQPAWGPGGSLFFVSDHTGWWNLYRWDPGTDKVAPVVELKAEIGLPQWVFGQSRYAFLADGTVVFAYQRDGRDHLATWANGAMSDLAVPDTSINFVRAGGSTVYYVGASATAEPAVIAVEVDDLKVAARRVLRPPRDLGIDAGYLSAPEAIDFPTTGEATAHALFYPPANEDHEGPPGERPPLLVFIHGGPTSAARPIFEIDVQYWTSRGFAVADVNYRGSTGYGR
ncbi:MAG: S9 family peptidase, partial [Acidimicrobiia bacterium]